MPILSWSHRLYNVLLARSFVRVSLCLHDSFSHNALQTICSAFFCQTKLLWLCKILWLSAKPTPVMIWIPDADTEDETTIRYTRCSVGGGLTSAHTISFRSGCSSTFLLCCAAVLCFPQSLGFLSCRLWCLSAKRHEACACIVMYLLLINVMSAHIISFWQWMFFAFFFAVLCSCALFPSAFFQLWCLSAKRHEACACIVMYLLLINYCQVTICRSCYVVRRKHSCNLWEITFACLTVTAYSACLTMKLPVLNFW